MQNITQDVLHYLDTGNIEHKYTINPTAMEQFIEELDLQEQINETELSFGLPIGSLD